MTVTDVKPARGDNAFANEINIYGFNFAEGATVELLSAQSESLDTVYVDGTHLRVTIPAGIAAGIYGINVSNPDGASQTLSNAYTAFEGGGDDLFALSEQLWSEPLTVRAEEALKIGLVVHRSSGRNVLNNVIVRFYLGDPNQGGEVLGDGAILLLSPRNEASTQPVEWTPPTSRVGSQTLCAVIDPANNVEESDEDNNTICRSLTVQRAASDQLAPHIDNFTINDGAESTETQQVLLDTTATDPAPSSGMASLLFIEYEFSQGANLWVPAQSSEWLPYEQARTDHQWQVLPSVGMKYLQAWAADNAGNITLFPFRAYINYAPPTDNVRQNQGRIYRYTLQAGQRLTVRVQPATGDPDLYVWPPDHETRPPWVSNLADQATDEVSIVAPVDGVYQIEVFGYTTTNYQLSIEITDSRLTQNKAWDAAKHRHGNKAKPTQPLIPLSNTPGSQQSLPSAPIVAPTEMDETLIYLPLLTR